MAKVRADRKACVRVDFPSPLAAVEWFQELLMNEMLPEGAALFVQDGLDELVGRNGVPSGNQFIVRREGSRPGNVTLNQHFEVTVGREENG